MKGERIRDLCLVQGPRGCETDHTWGEGAYDEGMVTLVNVWIKVTGLGK